MKVLHLSSEKGWRGGEQQIAYLISELTKAGVENIVAARKNSTFEKYCVQQNIPVSGVPFKSSVDIRTARAIKSLCSENDVSLVHMHSAKSHSLGVLSAVMGNSVPLILSRRVDFIPKDSWFTRWKYNHPSIRKVVCVSEKISSILKHYMKVPEKIVTVHSGVDLSKFDNPPSINKLREEFKIPSEKFLVGNSSALEGHKDYFTFLRTIGILVRKQLPVKGIIMGSGSLEKELQEFARENSLEDHILFTGFRKDIVDLIPGLDVFLMTSSEEGLGTSVLDAFLAKVPVVATNAGGIPEMVIHERSGLLAPVGNADLLAENVERMIHDKSLQSQIISGALERVKMFSKENTARKTLEIYKQVLGK
jgi:L-malate glycosyltransferase